MGDGLENLVNLRKLGVAQNQITTLDGLEPLQALDELDARDNCIEKVREVEFLERLPLFSSLLLQGNPCSDLPFYRRRVVFRLQQLRVLDGVAVTSDDKIKAINLHGGDESDLKHRRETFRKHFGSALLRSLPLELVATRTRCRPHAIDATLARWRVAGFDDGQIYASYQDWRCTCGRSSRLPTRLRCMRREGAAVNGPYFEIRLLRCVPGGFYDLRKLPTVGRWGDGVSRRRSKLTRHDDFFAGTHGLR